MAASNVEWPMLDKTRFFMLGSAIFSAVSATTYPGLVLKTRQQVCAHSSSMSSTQLAVNLVRNEGVRALYKGFGTSLLGTIRARALYLSTLEITRSNVGAPAHRLGLSESAVAATANAAAGFTASMASQMVWTPVDVISQRLMVRNKQPSNITAYSHKYRGGHDAFRTILRTDGPKGLYRGFGISMFAYAPSSALTWATYCMTQRAIWKTLSASQGANSTDGEGRTIYTPSSAMVLGVQGVSAACAGAVAAIVTTPLDTIKTRFQVMDQQGCSRRASVKETIRALLREEGGWRACYRGIAPRWAAMSISTITMIRAYEFLKHMSTKPTS